jgi:hypothetical protein
LAFNIEDFKANGLINGGARPSAFQVFIPDWPGSDADSEQRLRFLCKMTQLPPSAIGSVQVPYMGRPIKLIGDRQYSNWSISVYNDADFNLREAFERWHQQMNQHVENHMVNVGPQPNTYKRDAIVEQLGRDNTVLKRYTFKGIFPNEISAIALDWEAYDQIEMFEVNFSIDYWLPFADVGADETSFFGDTQRTISVG